MYSFGKTVPFTVDTDASYHSIEASLNQSGWQVAFFSRALNTSERKHSSLQKETQAIIVALRKWRFYIIGRHFILLFHQISMEFKFDSKHVGKIKNVKIQSLRVEFACIKYHPGKDNVTAYTLSGAYYSAVSLNTLKKLHNSLCPPHAWCYSNNEFCLVEEPFFLRGWCK